MRKGDRFFLPMGRNVRASIVMGDATFLFQHVHAPTRARRAVLPKEARGCWWRSLDKSFLSVLALSLFAQGGFEAVQEFYWRDTGQYLLKERTGTPKLLQVLAIDDRRNKQDEPVVVAVEPSEPPREAPVTEPVEPSIAVPETLVTEPMDVISEGADPRGELIVPEGPLAKGSTGTTRLVDARDVNIRFAPVNPSVPASRSLPSRGAGEPSPAQVADGKVGVVRVLDGVFGDERSPGVGVARHDDPWGGQGNEITSYAAKGDPNALWDSDPGLMPLTADATPVPSALAIAEALVRDTRPAPTPVITQPTKPLVATAPEAPAERKIRVSVKGGRVRGAVGTGKVDLAAVRDVVRKRIPGLQRTFLDAVRKNPGISGRIVVRITVGASGRARVVVVEDRIGDAKFARSLRRKIASWRFPKPKGGEVSFKVPLRFRAI